MTKLEYKQVKEKVHSLKGTLTGTLFGMIIALHPDPYDLSIPVPADKASLKLERDTIQKLLDLGLVIQEGDCFYLALPLELLTAPNETQFKIRNTKLKLVTWIKNKLP